MKKFCLPLCVVAALVGVGVVGVRYFIGGSSAGVVRTVEARSVTSVAAASQPFDANTLRVVTANVRVPTPEDKGHSWPERREVLAKTLLGQNADVLGLQEVTPAQAVYLIHELGGYDYLPKADRGARQSVLTPLNGVMSGMNMLFYRSDRFTLAHAENGLLRPESPQANVTEDAYYTLAVLEDKQKSWPTLVVVDTHLRHGAPNAVACAKRIQEKIAEQKRKYPGSAAVVMGDINHAKDSPVWKALRGAGEGELRDTFDYGKKLPKEKWGTWHQFTGVPRGAMPTDLIFVDSGLAGTAEFIKDFDEGTKRYPSDHFFVRTVVTRGKER